MALARSQEQHTSVKGVEQQGGEGKPAPHHEHAGLYTKGTVAGFKLLNASRDDGYELRLY